MRYVNPGYGWLFSVPGYGYWATLEDWTKNPNCGVMAYYAQTTTSYSSGSLVTTFNGEVYGKYITFCADNYGGYKFYFGSSSAYFYVCKTRVYVYVSSRLMDKSIAANDGFHSVYFHYKLADGENAGLFELVVDDVSLLSKSHSYSTSDSGIRLCGTNSSGSDYCIGNLILSAEYINPNEEVIIVPTSGVETDMTDNDDGTYTASEAGQTLLQTVDASDLITKYGRSSKLTSLAVAGVPAYNSDGALSLVGIDKIAGTVTEHDKVAVGSSDSVGAIDLWTTNMTIGKLDGKQVGWKAAT